MASFFAKHLFDGMHFHEDVRFQVENSRIVSFVPNSNVGHATSISNLVMPAMIDVQVNGGGGVQFNETPSLATLQQMSNAYIAAGTGSLMPTIITDDIATMQKAADAVAKGHQWDSAAIPGVHFEGPHLSVAKKGMHSAQHIRALSDDELALFTRPDIGTVIVTLAPEMVSPNDIRKLTNAGVIVSLGHSNASYKQCSAAFDAGAKGVTHLFNAMSPLTNREPGVVGSALYNDNVYCGLIVDLHHVHKITATLAIRLKRDERVMLVTDAMAPAASNVDHFYYQGIKVSRSENILKLENGTLAGSTITMEDAIKNTHFGLDIPLRSTLKMATSTPAMFIKKQNVIGTLQLGAFANFISIDEKLRVTQAWRNGKVIK